MPRPNKAFRQTRLKAAAAWKRGDKKEAYKMWEEAAKSLRDMRQAKRTRHAPPPPEEEKPAEAGEEAASEEAPAEDAASE